MKNITRLCSLCSAFVAMNSLLPQAKAYDFQYGFWNVYSPNALDHVVGQVNLQRTSEGGNPANGVSYWNPINSGQAASLTLEFTFSRPTTQINLYSHIATYNFGGGNFGSGSLWGSTNGTDWVSLMDAPTPSGIAIGYFYTANLPEALTGASQIWIQARLQTSGSDIMAQFSRQDTAANPNNIFELDANLVPAPEPSSVLLAIGGCALVGMQRLRGKKMGHEGERVLNDSWLRPR